MGGFQKSGALKEVCMCIYKTYDIEYEVVHGIWGGFQKVGVRFGSPHNQDPNVFGFSLAPLFMETI